MKSERDGINLAARPSGTGCVECSAAGGWWLHLRRCAECGHIGCCDTSPNQHASKHNAATGHPVITSFEPGERFILCGGACGRPYKIVTCEFLQYRCPSDGTSLYPVTDDAVSGAAHPTRPHEDPN